MSECLNISQSWKGFHSIRRLVVFGASYCSVTAGWPGLQDKLKPDATNPLGVPFPGSTWNEPNRPNWVGLLITKYCPEPRYRPSDAERYGCPTVGNEEEAQAAWAKSPLLVHNYAKGGDRVPGVKHQIEDLFLPNVGRKPEWAPWTESETLFVSWVGINDCAVINYEEIDDVVTSLMKTQDGLYDAGARNFLFIDLPTIHRTPAVKPHLEAVVLAKLKRWNTALHAALKEFGAKHSDATVLIFSSFQAFDTILDAPAEHGFNPADVKKFGGSIWVDHIHPTSKVHDHIARLMAAFLQSVPSTSEGSTNIAGEI